MRCALLMIVSTMALTTGAVETTPTPSMDGWRFTVGQPNAYQYEVTQNTEWSSAGDKKLPYVTTLRFRLIMKPTQVDDHQATLSVTFLSVVASHEGPGSRRLVDSTRPVGERGAEDPLLGHFLSLENAVFTVVCDPRTGVVSEVRGGDQVAERIAKNAPSAFSGDRSPLQKQAEDCYSSAHLSRLWSSLLTPPRSGTVAWSLGPPLDVSLDQVWSGSTWTCALPTNSAAKVFTIATNPTPVTASLKALKGSGSVSPALVPQSSSGTITYTLRFNAMTQPVDQQCSLTWKLFRLGAAPNQP